MIRSNNYISVGCVQHWQVICCVYFFLVPVFVPAMFYSQQPRFQLFQVINENHLSFEWTKMTTQSPNEVSQIAQNIKANSFFNRQLLQVDFHKNWLQLLHILKWGIQASAGTTLSYGGSNQGAFFVPMYMGSILSLQLTKRPYFIPFIAAGYSIWSIGFHTLSSMLFQWSAGAHISFSIMKPSLGYTLLDEYGIHDMGIIAKTTSYYFVENGLPHGNILIASLHIGVYFQF